MSRGFWTGLLEGIYNVQSAMVSDACLNKKITAKLLRVLDNLDHPDNIIGYVQDILDIAAIINNINDCGVEQLIYDLERFCDKNPCTIETAIKALTEKLFALIDKMNNIAECYVDFPNQTDEQI